MFATDNNERKPYFEPREAKPDHAVLKRAAVAVNQVMPPDVQNGFDSPPVSDEHTPCVLSLVFTPVKFAMLFLISGISFRCCDCCLVIIVLCGLVCSL